MAGTRPAMTVKQRAGAKFFSHRHLILIRMGLGRHPRLAVLKQAKSRMAEINPAMTQ